MYRDKLGLYRVTWGYIAYIGFMARRVVPRVLVKKGPSGMPYQKGSLTYGNISGQGPFKKFYFAKKLSIINFGLTSLKSIPP